MNIQLKTLAIFTAALILQACAASEREQVIAARDALPSGCVVDVYSPGERTPNKYDVLATIKLDDAGFSIHCGEDATKEAMRVEACKVGANGIIITKEHSPSLVSTCYRASAELIYVK